VGNQDVFQISDRVAQIPEALSIYINQIVYSLKRHGHDPIVLSLGEAFFDIPLYDFSKLDVQKSYHYSESQGLPELRRKISEYYLKYYRAVVDPDTELLITAGSKPAIFMAMQVVLNPADEIIIHEPAWLSYQEQARLLDAVPKFIPYDAKPQTFSKYFTPRTRIVVINNPNNPAGLIYSRRDLESIYMQCAAQGIYVMVDEAYSDFVIDETFTSMATVVPNKEGIIVVNSLSKNMGMSGWRIGYVVAHKRFIRELLKVNQHLITCAPTILSHYMARYFDDVLSVTLPQVQEVVLKRGRVAAMLDELGLQRLGGASTFYFFVSIGNFPGTSHDFAMHLLLERGIAVVPGSAYGESTDRFIRVAVGSEPEDRIWQALNVIRDLTVANTIDSNDVSARLAELNLLPFGRGNADSTRGTR
jgi:aspartate/methionine/tyrosine aminotransferase